MDVTGKPEKDRGSLGRLSVSWYASGVGGVGGEWVGGLDPGS